MKKWITQHKPYIFLTILTLFMVWFFVGRFAPFASNGDWSYQHSVIPEQFRQQFYDTGKLIPEFAAGLGGGQNIYNYSYYGLFSPIILPSYLLPFVKMGDYLIAVSLACLTASVLLMYYWLGTHGFSVQSRLSAAILFLLASPMIFQSHRQIMFVNYMPFLCMALIGIDRYLKKGKSGLYTAGVFLMVMTSFYFSIAGILALCLYGVSRCGQKPNKTRIFGFILPTAAAVCMAGILLIPTACALFARSGSSQKASIASLMIPDFSAERIVYSGYGLGLTIGIFAVLFLCLSCKSLKERFLSAGCLIIITVPFFSWILNGGLYARGKSLIPFLPVFCYLTAACLEGIRQKKISGKLCFAGYCAAVAWSIISFYSYGSKTLTTQFNLIFSELLLLPLFFALYLKTKRLPALIVPSVFCLVICGSVINEKDHLDAGFYQDVTDTAWGEAISGALQKEPGLFRLSQSGSYEENKTNINRTWDARQWSVSAYSSAYQQAYKDFRETIFQTEQPSRNCLMQPFSQNPLFQKFMGVKYLAVRQASFASTGKISVHKQEHTAPVIYATDQIIAEDSYLKLPFPYNQTALMQYAVTKEGPRTNAQAQAETLPDIRETGIRIPENDSVHKTDSGYSITSKKQIQTTLQITEQTHSGEQIFFLQFDVENQKENKDVIIELQNVRNNLSAKDHIYYNGNTTFTYVLKLEKQQENLKLLFHAGTYSISNIRSYLADAAILKEDSLYQSAFSPDQTATKGNLICGKLDAGQDGYLITSIPFDRGFEVRIDGRLTETEMVNTAFLGTKIKKGVHRIEITYHAPGLFLGELLSGIGVFLWAVLGISENRNRLLLTERALVVYPRRFRRVE